MTRGRPSTYTQEIADKICHRLAQGESLRAICRDDDMPNASTVCCDWVERYPDFALQYARAREAQADTIFDEIDEVVRTRSSDSVEAQDKRLFVDAQKWRLGQMSGKYLDKSAVDYTIKLAPPDDDEAARRVAFLLSKPVPQIDKK